MEEWVHMANQKPQEHTVLHITAITADPKYTHTSYWNPWENLKVEPSPL